MSIELRIPEVGESIQEVQIAQWRKQEGDRVELDEEVVELETDKASVDLPAPAAGVIAKIMKRDGERAKVGDVIAIIDETGGAKEERDEKDQASDSTDEGSDQGDKRKAAADADSENGRQTDAEDRGAKPPQPAPQRTPARHEEVDEDTEDEDQDDDEAEVAVTPSARRELRKHGLTAAQVPSDGKRLRRKDVLRHLEQQAEAGSEKATSEKAEAEPRPQPEKPESPKPAEPQSASAAEKSETVAPPSAETDRAELEEIKPLSWIRQRIAERLVAAQQNAALLTTFTEVEMTRVIELRRSHGAAFQEKHQVKLGFMSFFVKAVIESLREFPELNAEIRGDKIIYRHYYDIGIAIGSGKGLLVPIVRHAERLSFAGIENSIADFARRAQDNKLKPAELQGGTFTISNGGVYGSLLSTPIVNPPQSGVLGLHAMEDRPVARDGQVVIRPMMYVALTYDHRIIDGREAVTFLRKVKERIEDPARLLLDV